MQGKTLIPDLMLPEQKLQNLSFCDASPKPFKHWVSSLPMANIGQSSRQLYNAVVELNQLVLPAQQRLQLLELLRPRIYFVCEQLSQHYLGHSIALPEKQRKIANLCQALQLHLAHGYKAVFMDVVEKGAPDKLRQSLCQAGHRAITDLSATILRSTQLYGPNPLRSWQEAHQIFRYILAKGLGNTVINDSTNKLQQDTSVEDAYKRLLLLGSSRPNQLRQSELAQIYQLFESWTEFCYLSDEHVGSALFVINTERDIGPVYRSLLRDEITPACLGFDTTDLAQRLGDYLEASISRKSNPQQFLEVPFRVSDAVLLHLTQAMGTHTKRSFNRMSGDGLLQVCVGMSSVHYHCAGNLTFNAFLSEPEQTPDSNIFLKRKNDAWADAFDADGSDNFSNADTPINFRGASGNVEDGTANAKSYPVYRVPLMNTSPGGYCLKWSADMPPALQAGEVVALREADNHPWSIGVIRWIRQIKGEGTHVGVELLAPNAAPCGVRLLQKSGQSSEFLRALLLPELNSIDQPATVITPRVPFQSGHRIVLYHDLETEQTQLSRRVSATGSVSQFELKYRQKRPIGTAPTDGSATSSGDDDFDSLWPSL